MSQEQAADAFQEALLEDDPELLYEQAPCGYLSTTPDGCIIKANRTLHTWLGMGSGDLLGRHLVDLLTAGGRIYHETHYAPLLRMQGFVHEIAVDLRRTDGARLPVLLNATLVRRSDGSPQVIRIAVFDATERRSYERELVRARDAAVAAEVRAATLARTLQASLIPPTTVTVPGLEIATAYRPAGDGTLVGGDFYDVFPAGPEDWVVALGDVSGKGADAAVVTSLVRNTLRALTVLGHDLSGGLHDLNEVLRHHETERFCTLVVVRLRHAGADWRTTVTLGGHPPPLRLRSGREPQVLDLTGPLIGILPSADFSEEEVEFAPGDVLLLYTDGVTEARRDGQQFGEERFLAWAGEADASGDLTGLVDQLVTEVVGYQGGNTRDDIAVVALRHP